MARIRIPNVNAGVDPMELNATLKDLDPQGVIHFMETHESQAVDVFNWGAVNQPDRPWPGYTQLTTGNDLINWHLTRHAHLTHFDPVNTPLPTLALNNSMVDPIDVLIGRGRLDTLTDLDAGECWNPLGFAVLGWSYLAHALHYKKAKIADFIVGRAIDTQGSAFAVHPCEVANITGFPARGNHLDLLLQNKRYDLFVRLWNVIQPQNSMIVLNQRSKKKLCKFADRAMAKALLRNNGLNNGVNLAHINLDPVNNSRGTVWHLAVKNPNIDFLDFLHEHTPDTINWSHGKLLPLTSAYTENKNRYFQKLLAYNADPDAGAEEILETFPAPWATNKSFRAVLRAIRRPNARPIHAGTNLHTLVEVVHRQVDDIQNDTKLAKQKQAARRRKVMRRANYLIALVRQGNTNGRPDPRKVDMMDRTPMVFAESYSLPEIYESLRPNPGVGEEQREDGPRKGHRYNTRS
ncbi:hypothetical protein BJX76DRAFT_354703 [Aspergillus varians]